jgi:predicted outer membrane protein
LIAVLGSGVRNVSRTPQTTIRWLTAGVAVLILLAMVSLLMMTSTREGGTSGGQPRAASSHGGSTGGGTHAQPLATQNVAAVSAAPRAAGGTQEVTAADKDFLARVKLAGLWETPAGAMAEEKGQNERVREIGKMIGGQHVKLDALVEDAAAKLGVELPDEPNESQKRWLAEMENAEGEAFDQVFVDRLRTAHGGIFPAIGEIRAKTTNDIVRQMATDANGFVLTHLTLLESTGLVQWDSLDSPKAANGPLGAAQARSNIGGVSLSVIWVILAVALIAGGIGSSRLVRPRWIGGIRRSEAAQSWAPRSVPSAPRTGSVPTAPRTPSSGYPRPGTGPKAAPAPPEYGYPQPRRQSSSRRLVP